MKKSLLLILVLLCSFQTAFAEKIPIRITPAQIISTKQDEIEMGDWVSFDVVNNVYVNDKLYISKGTPIYGFVDFFHPNGWAADSADIKFKTFKTLDTKGNKITIDYPLTINGNSKKANDIKQYLSWQYAISGLLILVRGSEIYIEPDKELFNLFIEH